MRFVAVTKIEKKWVKEFLCYVLLAPASEPYLFYIFGEEKIGINILISILCSLAGDSVSITTLGVLSDTHFQDLFLSGKRFILINNPEDYENHYDIERVLQTFEMQATINVIIVGSQKPQILRFQNQGSHQRIKSLKSEGRFQNIESLIQKTGDSWFGAIAQERSSIINWLLQQEYHKSLSENSEYALSFTEIYDNSETSIDHFAKWVQEEIVVDLKAMTPLGASPVGKKVNENTVQESSLFATYLKFCSRHGIPETERFKHTMFAGKILESCLKLGYTVSKKRRSGGYYITGIRIRSYILSTDPSFGTQ